MDGFTLVDGVVALVIVISAILAYSRGIVRETMSILGWIAAAVIAFLFASKLHPLMSELPAIGKYLADSCELSVIAAFAAIFALALVLASLFTPLLSSVIQRSALGGVDQALGFIFGAARGVLLVMVAFLVYSKVLGADPVAMIDNSRSAQIFAQTESRLDQAIPSDAPGWIVARYNELTSVCTAA